jgi:hypothetical protein
MRANKQYPRLARTSESYNDPKVPAKVLHAQPLHRCITGEAVVQRGAALGPELADQSCYLFSLSLVESMSLLIGAISELDTSGHPANIVRSLAPLVYGSIRTHLARQGQFRGLDHFASP